MPEIPERLMQWNLNTVLVCGGFGATLVAWGMTWGTATADIEQNADRLNTLEARVGTIEVDNRRLDNHELRIASAEQRNNNTIISLKALETTLADLAGDMKVTREILQRIETKQNATERINYNAD